MKAPRGILQTVLGLVFLSPVQASSETLTDAWACALATNAQLASVFLDSEAAGYDVARARGARMPSMSVRGGYAARTDERAFVSPNPFSPGDVFQTPYRESESAVVGARVRAPIYSGGTVENGIRSASAQKVAADADTHTARLDLLIEVSRAYLGVLRAQRSLSITQEKLGSLQAHAAEAASLFKLKRAAKTDLLAAQTEAAEAERLRSTRKHELRTARGEYNRLLGRPLYSPVVIEEVPLVGPPPDLERLQSAALAHRPELVALHAASDAKQFAAARHRGHNRPRLMAEGYWEYEENRFQSPQSLASVGLFVEWKPYDGGQSQRLADAESTRAVALRRLEHDMRSRILLEVQTAWSSQIAALERFQAAEQGLEYSHENLRVIRLRFSAGQAVGSEVLDAVARTAASAGSSAEAAYDLAEAELKTQRAVGVLGEQEPFNDQRRVDGQ